MLLRIVFVYAASDDRMMYAEYLRAHGLEVVEADTTDDALTVVAAGDVVITELTVPGSLTPFELIGRIRNRPSTPALSVLVLTACMTAETRAAATHAGADVVLMKPCYPDALLREVHRLLEKRRIRYVGGGVYLVPVAERRSRPRDELRSQGQRRGKDGEQLHHG